MSCNCKDWQENIVELQKPWHLWFSQNGDSYNGKQFNFCPWCGKSLKLILLNENNLQI